MLHGDVLRAHRVDVVPLRELDRDVVEDQVRGVEQVDPALGAVRIQIALAEAQTTNDVVRRARERRLAPHHADAIAWRGLAC
ncbi:MAG TPA: hypothetical protein VKU41_14740, partial [Polyangiaceae bacterium]|nr:hypothetical protein [Polyangiaceae bacterium]